MCVVRLSFLADRDLDEIRDYINSRTPEAADRLLEQLFKRFQLLATQPLLGQLRDDLRPNLRLFSAGSYVVFYYPAVNGIHVARVVHSSRDFTAIFPRQR